MMIVQRNRFLRLSRNDKGGYGRKDERIMREFNGENRTQFFYLLCPVSYVLKAKSIMDKMACIFWQHRYTSLANFKNL